MDADTQPIEFDCEIVQVRTMADGSPRVVLGLPETCAGLMGDLAIYQREGIYLHAELIPVSQRAIYDRS